MLNARCDTTWNLKEHIEGTRQIMLPNGFKDQRYYREANEVWDALAKWGATCSEIALYYAQGKLPMEAKGPYRSDNMQMPNFRIRQVKPIEYTYFLKLK